MKIIAVKVFQLNTVEEKKPGKIQSGLNGNRTNDLCDTGAVL